MLCVLCPWGEAYFVHGGKFCSSKLLLTSILSTSTLSGSSVFVPVISSHPPLQFSPVAQLCPTLWSNLCCFDLSTCYSLCQFSWCLSFPCGLVVVFLPMQAMQEKWVWSLDWEDLLEEEMATHSSILAWEVLWQRSLVGFSPWGPRASDMTEHRIEWAVSLPIWLVLEGPEEIHVPRLCLCV